MSFASDTNKTEERLGQLRAYMDKKVLGPGGFVCTSFPACRRSAKAEEPDGCFFEGQLSHVGVHYDLSEDGQPLRILVIPMDTGGAPPKVTLDARRVQVLGSAVQDGRNQHMWGTVFALRLAVGRDQGKVGWKRNRGTGTFKPLDSAGEKLIVDSGGGPAEVHLFDCYVMANTRLCSATRATGNESRGTRKMSWNCYPHLAKTIEILKPTLCIIQGSGVAADIESAPASIFGLWRRQQIDKGLPLWWVQLPGGEKTLLAAFRHPSRNWYWPSAPHLVNVVAPTIRLARRQLGLPVAPPN